EAENQTHTEILRRFRLQPATKTECGGGTAVWLQLRVGAGRTYIHRRIETFAERWCTETSTGSGAQRKVVGEVVAGSKLANCLVAEITVIFVAHRKVQNPVGSRYQHHVQERCVVVAVVGTGIHLWVVTRERRGTGTVVGGRFAGFDTVLILPIF